MTVDQYLASIKARLLSDPVILSFHIVRERMTLTDAHLRVRLTLADASCLEFSEYAQRSGSGKIEVITYSYHWADASEYPWRFTLSNFRRLLPRSNYNIHPPVADPPTR